MTLLNDNVASMARASARNPQFVGNSACVEFLGSRIEAVSRRSCTVLIQGETGVGKELAARQIHTSSTRAAGPFVPLDCTTCSDTLFESQLFGHVKGAFTGAEQATLGFFRAADGGTLFLDEVGELTLPAQAKLLRCIQDRAVVPLGGVEPLPVNVRLIAATHRDLGEMAGRGRFRRDLYFRLSVVCVHVPPLRERRYDVALLAEHFLRQAADLYEEPTKTLSADAIEALEAYDWPGNVRELQNAVEHVCAFCPDRVVGASDLPRHVRTSPAKRQLGSDPTVIPLNEAERSLIAKALRAAGGNQTRAAGMLGVERHRLHRKILRYGLRSLTNRKRG